MEHASRFSPPSLPIPMNCDAFRTTQPQLEQSHVGSLNHQSSPLSTTSKIVPSTQLPSPPSLKSHDHPLHISEFIPQTSPSIHQSPASPTIELHSSESHQLSQPEPILDRFAAISSPIQTSTCITPQPHRSPSPSPYHSPNTEFQLLIPSHPLPSMHTTGTSYSTLDAPTS